MYVLLLLLLVLFYFFRRRLRGLHTQKQLKALLAYYYFLSMTNDGFSSTKAEASYKGPTRVYKQACLGGHDLSAL